MRVEFILTLLSDEHEHHDEEREQSYRSLKPRKRSYAGGRRPDLVG